MSHLAGTIWGLVLAHMCRLTASEGDPKTWHGKGFPSPPCQPLHSSLSAPSPWNHLASPVTPSPQGPPQGLDLASITRPERRGNGLLISDRTEQHPFPFPKEVTASMPVACDFLAL